MAGTGKKTSTRKQTAKKSTAKKKPARRYGAKAGDMVAEELHELKAGRLRSSSGAKVESREQAIAIGLSEARRAGGKVPPPKKR